MFARLAKSLLTLFGWRLEAPPPDLNQYVLIAAPHTSNWDFPLMILCAMAFRIKIRWLGKKSLFDPPFGWLMTAMGGLPVRRSGGHSQVDSMREIFAENSNLILAVPPEGTRDHTTHWRSGFYHIAHGANVPIVGSYLDYGQKRAGFGDPLYPTGNIPADMDVLRSLYAPMRGKYPEKSGAIKLREEIESDTGSS
jgi:1-acyl-sn-glycerol-3-phosphate acyltransferase